MEHLGRNPLSIRMREKCHLFGSQIMDPLHGMMKRQWQLERRPRMKLADDMCVGLI